MGVTIIKGVLSRDLVHMKVSVPQHLCVSFEEGPRISMRSFAKPRSLVHEPLKHGRDQLPGFRCRLSCLTRPVPDGTETGMFETPAGGRRYRALESLVRQRRLNKITPVPCAVRTDGLAEEDSLAENI